jgi:hypothetical protein
MVKETYDRARARGGTVPTCGVVRKHCPAMQPWRATGKTDTTRACVCARAREDLKRVELEREQESLRKRAVFDRSHLRSSQVYLILVSAAYKTFATAVLVESLSEPRGIGN